MEPNAPGVNLTDSVQVGHNAIGPTTGDIVINSGSQTEHCSMCKTPIDAKVNPGLYCFKEGCETLFCRNCESFFRAERGPGEKPYCSEHIGEFVGAPIPNVPPGLKQPQTTMAQPRPATQVVAKPTQVVVGHVQQASSRAPTNQQFVGFGRANPNQVVDGRLNPYLNLQAVDPMTALRRTIRSWNGEGRCQRSEFWWGALLYYFMLAFTLGFFSVFIFAAADAGSSEGWLMGSMGLITVMLVLLIPLLSQQIRRLHDIGASGWWVLLAFFVPYVGWLILFVMSLLPSQPHPNKYG